MSLENVAVQGCIASHSAGSTVTGGAFTITSTPSTKVKAENKGVLKTPLSVSFTGGTFPGLVPGTVFGTGIIASTVAKTKAENVLVMREGDTGTFTGVGTLPPPAVGTGPATGPIEISSEGQTQAKAQ